METGQRGATPRDVRDLCELYSVTDDAERERLMVLAREGRQQGWWQSYSLPYKTFVGLEQEATSMTIYHSAVVPGLLQIGDYTRGIHEKGVPQLNAAEVEERVAERATRQQLLTRETPRRSKCFWIKRLCIGRSAARRSCVNSWMAFLLQLDCPM